MELGFCSLCAWFDIKLAAGLSFSLPSWILSFWMWVCEDGNEANDSMNCTVFAPCSSWDDSSLSVFWLWGWKDGFVSSRSCVSETDEWGRYKTSPSLNSRTCSSSCCWPVQSSWTSSLMCRGSGSVWSMLSLGSCTPCCSGGVSSLQMDDWERSRQKAKKRTLVQLSFSYFFIKNSS